jgi:hypothetical protein
MSNFVDCSTGLTDFPYRSFSHSSNSWGPLQIARLASPSISGLKKAELLFFEDFAESGIVVGETLAD